MKLSSLLQFVFRAHRTIRWKAADRQKHSVDMWRSEARLEINTCCGIVCPPATAAATFEVGIEGFGAVRGGRAGIGIIGRTSFRRGHTAETQVSREDADRHSRTHLDSLSYDTNRPLLFQFKEIIIY